jgi:hypothetical protein
LELRAQRNATLISGSESVTRNGNTGSLWASCSHSFMLNANVGDTLVLQFAGFGGASLLVDGNSVAMTVIRIQ